VSNQCTTTEPPRPRSAAQRRAQLHLGRELFIASFSEALSWLDVANLPAPNRFALWQDGRNVYAMAGVRGERFGSAPLARIECNAGFKAPAKRLLRRVLAPDTLVLPRHAWPAPWTLTATCLVSELEGVGTLMGGWVGRGRKLPVPEGPGLPVVLLDGAEGTKVDRDNLELVTLAAARVQLTRQAAKGRRTPEERRLLRNLVAADAAGDGPAWFDAAVRLGDLFSKAGRTREASDLWNLAFADTVATGAGAGSMPAREPNILDQVKALGNPLSRIKTILKNRDAVPAMPGAVALVELSKLSTKLAKVTAEFLSGLDETPTLPGIEVAEEDGAA